MTRARLATTLALTAVLAVVASPPPVSAYFVSGSFQLYDPMSLGAADIPETIFGKVIATGDFDGDGKTDMAVGTPNRDTAGVHTAGAVFVVYGSDTGLDAASTQTWTRSALAIPGVPSSNDSLGGALAAGDFDGDGYDDLAIGVPKATVDGQLTAGFVTVLFGSASGLRSSGSESIDQSDLLGSNPQAGDRFGEALAAGDFNADGIDDLAIGASYEVWLGSESAGIVHVIHGDSDGLLGNANQYFLSPVLADDQFYGTKLAAGDVAGDAADDLIVTAIGGNDHAGVVHVLTGNEGALFVDLDFADSYSVEDCDYDSTGNDLFGFALAVADFDGSGREDVAIGAPRGWGTRGFICLLLGDDDGIDMDVTTVTPAYFGPQMEAGDNAGWALASGDFDLDGRADLAVGIPRYDLEVTDEGFAAVFWGDSDDPLKARVFAIFTQNSIEYPEVSEPGDLVGRGMAAGDFDGDGVDDVAIGVPGDSDDDGSVVTFRGGRDVLFADGFESGDTSRWE